MKYRNFRSLWPLWVVLALTLSAVMACQNKYKRTAEDAQRKAEVVDDTTLWGRLKAADKDSLWLSMDSDRSVVALAIDSTALEGLRGSLTVGDTLAVIAENGTQRLACGYNITELLGSWIFDDGSGNGFRIERRGGVATIGTQEISLRTWQIWNGCLRIVYVDTNGKERATKTDEPDVITLTKDELVIYLAGTDYHCHRMERLLK